MSDFPAPLTADSRLADLLTAYPGAAERLADLHPAFGVLRSTANRAGMERLVRLGEVAGMAGIPVDTLIAAARGEAVPRPAFAGCAADSAVPGAAAVQDDPDDWFAQAEREFAQHLDVRPILAGGRDPFVEVMAAAAKVPAGGFMVLDAPFDPAPLRRVMAGKGFASIGRKLAETHWRICWRRDGAEAEAPAPRRSGQSWTEADGLHLDVRGLEPPKPMTMILDLIDSGTVDALTVHHEREPLFLYPELAERGWICESVENLGGEVRLKLALQPS